MATDQEVIIIPTEQDQERERMVKTLKAIGDYMTGDDAQVRREEVARIESEMVAKCEKDGYFEDVENNRQPDQAIRNAMKEAADKIQKKKQDHIIDVHDGEDDKAVPKYEKDGYFRDPERTTPDYMDHGTYHSISHSVRKIEKFFEEEKKKDAAFRERNETARRQRTDVINYIDGEARQIKKAIADNKGKMDVIMMCANEDVIARRERAQTIKEVNEEHIIDVHDGGDDKAIAKCEKDEDLSAKDKEWIAKLTEEVESDVITMGANEDCSIHKPEEDQTIKKTIKEFDEERIINVRERAAAAAYEYMSTLWGSAVEAIEDEALEDETIDNTIKAFRADEIEEEENLKQDQDETHQPRWCHDNGSDQTIANKTHPWNDYKFNPEEHVSDIKRQLKKMMCITEEKKSKDII